MFLSEVLVPPVYLVPRRVLPDTLGGVSLQYRSGPHVLEAKFTNVNLGLLVVVVWVLRLVPRLHLVASHLYVPDALAVREASQVVFLWGGGASYCDIVTVKKAVPGEGKRTSRKVCWVVGVML